MTRTVICATKGHSPLAHPEDGCTRPRPTGAPAADPNLRTFDHLEQGSDEWHDARRGILTASVIGQIISARTLTAIDFACPACEAAASSPCVGRSGAPIKTLHSERAATAREADVKVIRPASNPESRSLAALLASERITGWTEEGYYSAAMERGHLEEPHAVEAYSENVQTVTRTGGFMVRDFDGFSIGYSPDGIVGAPGVIECKSRAPKVHLQTVLADEVPAENVAQCQAALLVSGRAWCDYVSFSGGMALWVKRVYPDPEWQAALVEAARTFEAVVQSMVATYTERTAGLPLTERVTPEGFVI